MHMSWGQNFHLHLTYLLSFGSLVNFHVPLAMGDSYSSCIAASYLLASWNLNTLHKSKGSLTNTILARCLVCWGRTCFFHHSLGGCHSPHLFWLPPHLQPNDIPLVVLTIITQKWFGRFIHNNYCRAFIPRIWTHLQNVSYARAILHECHISTSMTF